MTKQQGKISRNPRMYKKNQLFPILNQHFCENCLVSLKKRTFVKHEIWLIDNNRMFFGSTIRILKFTTGILAYFNTKLR